MRLKTPTSCRLLAPCRVNGNQTSIIAATTQEGQDRGKAGARKEHCLIDEQIHLARSAGPVAGREIGGGQGRAGPLDVLVGSPSSLTGGWVGVIRLRFSRLAGVGDEDR